MPDPLNLPASSVTALSTGNLSADASELQHRFGWAGFPPAFTYEDETFTRRRSDMQDGDLMGVWYQGSRTARWFLIIND